MITIPYSVAKMITLNKMHPVTAWRIHYRITKKTLAEQLKTSEQEVTAIETSNKHLTDEKLEKLSQIFGVYPAALNIRFVAI